MDLQPYLTQCMNGGGSPRLTVTRINWSKYAVSEQLRKPGFREE